MTIGETEPHRARAWRTGRWVSALLLALALLPAVPGRGRAANPMVDPQMFNQNDLRAIGMGNAFGAVARGENALVYNPAGLAQTNLGVKVEYGITLAGSPKFLGDTYALMGGSGFSAPGMLNYLNSYAGTTQSLLVQTFLSGVVNMGQVGFGAGYGSLATDRFNFAFGPASNLSLDPTAQHMGTDVGAAAFKLFQGKVILGVAGKTLAYSEQSMSQPLSLATLLTSSSLKLTFNKSSYPTQATYDAGILYRSEAWSALRPQWSFVAFNVPSVTFKGTNSKGVASQVEVQPSYNLGLSMSPKWPLVHLLFAAELEDLGSAIKLDPAGTIARSAEQRTHFGLELGFLETPFGNNVLSARAGSNRGLFTYGYEVNLWSYLRLVYAKGQDDLGWEGAPNVVDFEAYQLALAIAW